MFYAQSTITVKSGRIRSRLDIYSSSKVKQLFRPMLRCSSLSKFSTKPLQEGSFTGLPPFNMQSVSHVLYTAWRTLDGKALALFIMQLLYRFFRVCLQSAGFLSNIETNSCKRSKIFTKAVAHSVNDLTSYYRRHETIV